MFFSSGSEIVREMGERGGRAYCGDVLILETHFFLDNQLVTKYPIKSGVLESDENINNSSFSLFRIHL